MKNLENYGVQELNAKEIKLVNGGSWPRIAKFIYDTVVGTIGSELLSAAANGLTYEQRQDYYKYRGM